MLIRSLSHRHCVWKLVFGIADEAQLEHIRKQLAARGANVVIHDTISLETIWLKSFSGLAANKGRLCIGKRHILRRCQEEEDNV